MVDPSEWIERAAREQPDRVFLVTPQGARYTYADLLRVSGDIASALTQAGVVVGDRVAVRVEKSPEAVFLYVACLRLGAAFVPVNVAYSVPEVEYFLTDSQSRVAVVDPPDVSVIEPVARRAGVARVLTLADLQRADDSRGTLGSPDFDTALRPQTAPDRHNDPDHPASSVPSAADLHRASVLRADSLAAIVYTSGTTGRSKGAMLTRANLASNATALVDSWRFTRDDVLLHVLPLFHVHGLFAALNTVLASGAGMVLMSKFDARQTLTHFPEVTVFMGVPTHYTRLLQEPALNRDITRGIRLFVSGSAPLLAETHQEFYRRTGHEVLERYGMTETLMNTSNPYDGPRVPGSVGPPLPRIAVRVVDPETGKLVAIVGATGEGPMAVRTLSGTIGALELKGPNVFAGYWRDEQKTRSEFTADGWFKTGDLGRIDDRGYVHIVGRAKDLVISGGYNVYPKEVECELDAVPGVAESAVFGVPHPDFGEGVTAAVVLVSGTRLTEADLLNSIRSRLAGYKLPKRILFVDELPRNTMGKVQKNLLRATHSGLYDPASLRKS